MKDTTEESKQPSINAKLEYLKHKKFLDKLPVNKKQLVFESDKGKESLLDENQIKE